MKLKKIVTAMSVAMLSGAVLTGCLKGDDGKDGKDASAANYDEQINALTAQIDSLSGQLILDKTKAVLETNAQIAYASYSDSVTTAVALQNAIAAFKANPTAETMMAAKNAWLASREPYGQTEVYRFRLSPIDSTNYADEDGPEGDINAWPLGEALIDYTVSGTDFGDGEIGVTTHETGINYPTENIINSGVTIDEALISNTATAEDEHDVIAGYHAIEFMLWGQDLNQDGSADTANGARDMTGGQRPLTDFTSDPLADRRFQYMEVVAQKLVDDLISVRDAWAPGAAYRSAFTGVTTQSEANDKITEILTAMGTLGASELAGERMQIALTANSQEDEHSCFSDNTHRDIVTNAMGISNNYYGEYLGYDSDMDGLVDSGTPVIGYGMDDLLRDLGENTVASDFEALLNATKAGYDAIDASARAGMPFDNQIQNGAADAAAADVRATILALNAQSQAIRNSLVDALDASDFDPNADTECNVSNPTEEC